jgi:hypothetical protein
MLAQVTTLESAMSRLEKIAKSPDAASQSQVCTLYKLNVDINACVVSSMYRLFAYCNSVRWLLQFWKPHALTMRAPDAMFVVPENTHKRAQREHGACCMLCSIYMLENSACVQVLERRTNKDDAHALQAAQACYDEGRSALVEYFAIANKGLTRELNKVTTPFDQ